MKKIKQIREYIKEERPLWILLLLTYIFGWIMGFLTGIN